VADDSPKLFHNTHDRVTDRIDILANVALTGIPAESERFIKFFRNGFKSMLQSRGRFLFRVNADITERKTF
jgi:hypothetical protein